MGYLLDNSTETVVDTIRDHHRGYSKNYSKYTVVETQEDLLPPIFFKKTSNIVVIYLT